VLDKSRETTQKVRREDFRSSLRQAIERAIPEPTTEAQSKDVMKHGGERASGQLRSSLATERDAATGTMKSAVETEVTASSKPALPEAKLQLESVGPPPAPVSAAPVVPAPLPPERLDYSSDRAPTDQAMAENNVTEEQMQNAQDPAFAPALNARSTAKKHEAAAEANYRQGESKVQDQAEAKATAVLTKDLAGIDGTRAHQIGKVVTQQQGTKTKDAQERQRITDIINGIKNKTRTDVGTILTTMETEAGNKFEAGLKRAEKAYEDTFKEEKGGIGTRLWHLGRWDEHIAASLAKARKVYFQEVDKAIDEVATFVDEKITAAKKRVADGRKEVEDFVNGLEMSVKRFGEEALQAVSADFDDMVSDIDQRRDGLINKLTEQYKASYERMSAMEEKLREENKSLWQRVYDATVGLIKKIIEFKNMLLSVLGKAAAVVLDIIAHPIRFLGNLVSGVMQGLKNFMSKIGTYLIKGLMDWLFGALAGAGLQLPDKFDLQGIISIVFQILGLTYASFRARAVAIVGEPVVAAIEKTAEVFKVILTEGVPGLWRFIKEQLANLKTMVIDAIFDYIKEKVIMAGITWIIGLLNPASAFFKACKAIYDIVMFFITRGRQILALVNAVIDSMAAIAKGSIGVAAGYVENALAKAIPVAIGFLASLLGLGDPSKPVREFIEKARAPVNKAIDWVINMAVKGVKAAGKFIGGILGKRDTAHEDDPMKAAKIQAGLVALHTLEASEAEGGELTPKNAKNVAKQVKKNHRVFKSLEAVPTKEGWEYEYTASERRREPSPLHRRFDDEQIYRMVQDLARVRFAHAEKAAEGTASLAIKPGDAPAELAAKIKGREVIPPRGSTVAIPVGGSTVFAKQGTGVGNIIVAGLGKYPEITQKLATQGFDGPKIHAAVMEVLRTGTGHPDIKRLTVLMFGAEPARLEIAAVTGPLVVGELGKGAKPGQAFGEKGEERLFGGGFDPVSMERAAPAGRRAAEIAEGKTFREGTQIHERTKEHIQRTVELVYDAVKKLPVRDADQLRARISELLEHFDRSAGVT
jgi:hypothetical protein